MTRVLLINPSWPGLVSARGGRYNRSWPPLDLLNCAALMRRNGLEAELADARALGIPPGELRRRARRADWVVLTSSPLDRWQCPNLELDRFTALARSLEHPRLVVAGVHGSLYPQRVLQETGARAVILGEPEEAAAELASGAGRAGVRGVAYLSGDELKVCEARPALDLSRLPIPAFDLAPPARYGYEALGGDLALLETSRGCRHACSFCLKEMYGPGVRYKDPEQVVAEAREAVRLGARRAYIMDLDFTSRRGRALEVCRGLEGAGLGLEWCCQARADAVDRELLQAMRRAGCRLIHFGLESASRRVLEGTGKGLDPERARWAVRETAAQGMDAACFFLFGLPGETAADRARTIALARSLEAAFCSFHRATAYPGTRLFRARPGRDPFAPAPPRPRDDIDAAIRRAYLGFYLHPRRMLRLLGRGGPGAWLRGVRLLAGFLR